MIDTKRCSKCFEEKSVMEFGRASEQPDGFKRQCKVCLRRALLRRKGMNEAGDIVDPAQWEKFRVGAGQAAKRWRETNPEAYRRSCRQQWVKNGKAVQATYRTRHRDRLRERDRKLKARKRLEQPEVIRAIYHRNRAKRRAAVGEFDGKDVNAAFRRQGGRCLYCEEKIGRCSRRWHIDHFIPLARGGTNMPENIVVACASCNLSKSSKMPWEFLPGKFAPPEGEAGNCAAD